jgi:hypothetical protein
MPAFFQKRPDPWTILSEKLEVAKTMLPGRDLEEALAEILEARHPNTGRLLLGITGYGTPIINTFRKMGLIESLIDQICIRLESGSFDDRLIGISPISLTFRLDRLASPAHGSSAVPARSAVRRLWLRRLNTIG